MSTRSLLALLLAANAVAMQKQPAPKPARALSDFSSAIEELTAAASPAVVQIEVRSRGVLDTSEGRRAGYYAEQRSSGSGVIVDPAGYIVTNAHVVEGARQMNVSVTDAAQAEGHRHFDAKLVGVDKETDLAVIKIDATALPTLQFLDSDTLRQGQVVIALGSPLGLENTLTVGFVSATQRQLSTARPFSYIQTDAPINPGNSGGPLLNIQGRIAGINTLIITQSGGSEGIGFAIPANTVKDVYQQLRAEGHIHRGAIGVVPQEITPVLASALGIPIHPGVMLADVLPHGAAEAAGLQPGDVVVAVEGKPAMQARQLVEAIFRHRIGDRLVLQVRRGTETMEKTVAIVERPNSPGMLADLADSDNGLIRDLGILVAPLDGKAIAIVTELRDFTGVIVAAVPAEFATLNPGLIAGDVIHRLNGKAVSSVKELRDELKTKKTGDAIALQVEREGRFAYLAFELP